MASLLCLTPTIHLPPCPGPYRTHQHYSDSHRHVGARDPRHGHSVTVRLHVQVWGSGGGAREGEQSKGDLGVQAAPHLQHRDSVSDLLGVLMWDWEGELQAQVTAGLLLLLPHFHSFIPIAGCIISTVPIGFVALTGEQCPRPCVSPQSTCSVGRVSIFQPSKPHLPPSLAHVTHSPAPHPCKNCTQQYDLFKPASFPLLTPPPLPPQSTASSSSHWPSAWWWWCTS